MELFSQIKKNVPTLEELLDGVVLLFLVENHTLVVSDLYIDVATLRSKYATGDLAHTSNISIKILLAELLESLGVYIAFSGKNDAEKAVLIDSDADLLSQIGVSADHFKMGQTILRNASENKENKLQELDNDIPTTLLSYAIYYVAEACRIKKT